MFKLQQVNPDSLWWEREARSHDQLVYDTEEWIRFVAEAHHAEPVFAEIWDGSSRVGSFSGLIFSRYGVPILGSPFPGWTTMYMGFNLEPGVPRWRALQALQQFAFNELGCLHFEISDHLFTRSDGERNGLVCRFFGSYETDLTKPEEELFSELQPSCRRCIRKAQKSGVVIEESHGDDLFVNDYYEQLKDVFLKQGLVPTYSREVVQTLVRHLYPTGRLLLLRARDGDGNCIATGLYPGTKRLAQFWGNASFRSSQHLRPNQALNWYALRYWRARGAECFDWGGEGVYKEKYGCRQVVVHRFCKSRIPLLLTLRDNAQKLFYYKQRVKRWWAPTRV